MQRAPGQGQSKKARQRRNRKQQPTQNINLQMTVPTVPVKPKGRRVQQARRRLDPYLSTLMDPENVTGVRCPGLAGVPTGVFQATADLSTASDANGNFAIAVNPCLALLGSPNVFGGYTSATSTGLGALTWGGGTAALTTTVGSLYDTLRPVSGCIKVEYMGNTQNDQGMVTGFWDTYTDVNNATQWVAQLNSIGTGCTTVGSALGKGYNATFPIRNGTCVLWRPLDYSNFSFISTSSNASRQMPFIAVVATGLAANAALMVRLVFNYEGTPLNDFANVVQSSGPQTPLSSADKAASWGQWLGDKITPLFGVIDEGTKKSQMLLQSFENASSNAQRAGGFLRDTASTARNLAQLYGAYQTYNQLNRGRTVGRLIEY